jgi:hypothetical protein
MIDKVLYREVKVSQTKTVYELVLLFDCRGPFTLSADSKQGVLDLYDWFMVPLEASNNFVSFRDYTLAVASSLEDTQVTYIETTRKVA